MEAKSVTNRSWTLILATAALVLAGSVELANVHAQTVVRSPASGPSDFSGPVVKEVEIIYVGPKSVSESLILSNMRTTVGRPFSANSIEEDIRNLYATGLFVNLRIRDEALGEGVKVIVIVQPKPIIKEIVIKGNSRISRTNIRKAIAGITPGAPLSEQAIASGVDLIKTVYQDKGFRDVAISYKIDVNETFGRAVVTYNISEGPRAYVKKINFEGNNNVDKKKLRKAMQTKTRGFLSFLDNSGVYRDAMFREDLKNLRRLYQSEGYIDMQVKDVKYEYPGEDSLEITIVIYEGIRYKVGGISFEGNSIFTTPQIRSRLKMLEGEVFSTTALAADLDAVQDLYGERGYIDTSVSPKRLANVESGRMDLLYIVKEGPQAFVQQIVIQGNNKTKDKVIRRELAVFPGEVYDSVRANASKKRLENLDYFAKVDISPEDTNVPNRKNMVVTVEEKRTGSFTFGAGFSSVDSLLGYVEVSPGNFDIANWKNLQFTGAGQKFRARLQYGLQRRDFLFSFTEPWFLDQRLSLGASVYGREAQFLTSAYNQRTFGATVSLAKPLARFLTGSIAYKIENIELFDFDDGVSSIIREEEGGRLKSAITIGLRYDSRDSVFLTRRGEQLSINAEFAGGPLLGETDIYKVSFDFRKFWAFEYDLILMLRVAGGVVDNYDDTSRVPIFDRQFLGGSRSVRGFDNREIGPRDEDGEPIGGKTFGQGNLELTFPIMERVRGAVFVDSGFVDSEAWQYENFAQEINAAAGFGLRLNLPIGPLRLDFGIPFIVSDERNESTGKFSFDVGYQF